MLSVLKPNRPTARSANVAAGRMHAEGAAGRLAMCQKQLKHKQEEHGLLVHPHQHKTNKSFSTTRESLAQTASPHSMWGVTGMQLNSLWGHIWHRMSGALGHVIQACRHAGHCTPRRAWYSHLPALLPVGAHHGSSKLLQAQEERCHLQSPYNL